jgi:malic enzyme
VSLDVGTDNGDLLRDPLYIGWRQPRMRGDEYWEFVDEFAEAVKRCYPNALLQWEDFGKSTSFRHLEAHRSSVLSFNDDIQGTAAVSVAGLLGAMRLVKGRLRDQRIVLLGAGSAGVGISRLIVDAMREEGMPAAEARARIYTLDSKGLVVEGRPGLDEHKREFAVAPERIAEWGATADRIPLLDVVRRVQPTVLFGVSGQAGVFTEEVVREMARHTQRPIILPLSNPTSCAEARPVDVVRWTEGRAIVGTGSPFDDVLYDGRRYRIGQGNNVFIFPGVGLGAIIGKARRVTDGMFLAASRPCRPARPRTSFFERRPPTSAARGAGVTQRGFVQPLAGGRPGSGLLAHRSNDARQPSKAPWRRPREGPPLHFSGARG